jgi:hypothetical protein
METEIDKQKKNLYNKANSNKKQRGRRRKKKTIGHSSLDS